MKKYHIKTLRIQCTSSCNLDCYYCCGEGYRFTEKNVDSDMLYRFYSCFDDEIGFKQVKFTGGEPLLCQELPLYIRAIKSKRSVPINIVTNGTNPEKIDAIINSSRAVNFTISVPHFNEQRYDRTTRTVGNYEKISESIKILRKHEIPFRFNNVITLDTLNYLSEYIQFAIKYRSDIKFIQLIRNNVNSDIITENDMPPIDMIMSKFNEIDYYKDPSKSSVTDIALRNRTSNHTVFLTGFFCSSGFCKCPEDKTSLWLSVDGMASLCSYSSGKRNKIEHWSYSSLSHLAKDMLQNEILARR